MHSVLSSRKFFLQEMAFIRLRPLAKSSSMFYQVWGLQVRITTLCTNIICFTVLLTFTVYARKIGLIKIGSIWQQSRTLACLFITSLSKQKTLNKTKNNKQNKTKTNNNNTSSSKDFVVIIYTKWPSDMLMSKPEREGDNYMFR